ncbi:phosphate transporter PHO1 homolog 10-like isoform X2 [Spinacia oleracea]|uniref:Phosphate transporter PHO1 homolog 10-like isoform X2 n=1 Tax=Spinacia oleracea TaxID=3562 RepID=A0ABM3QN30_SPIOL|nr:phosphate transporter PHO1 homolog 10-like isoform X2 [Spinacia oleracea]
MEEVFGLYRSLLYIVLHIFMYGVDIYSWGHYQVNYALISGQMGSQKVFLLSTMLAVPPIVGFIANSIFSHSKWYAQLIPLAVLLVFVVICIINDSSRYVIKRLCQSLYGVTFLDFFLVDQLTSQVPAMRGFVSYVCHYISPPSLHTFLHYAVAILPYGIRALQG